MFTTDWHSRYNLDYRLKTKFRRKLNNFQKNNPEITPFILKTKTLASNWWGKFWNAHLKNYTFNTVRLEKGKLYLRCGALADFKITPNHVEAIVLGSRVHPYHVKIIFEPLSETRWMKIQKLCDGHLESFEKILDNQFPKEMADIFTNKPSGLFPSKNEITFDCSCPDRANLCKHTAVALYALGAKLDDDPQLLYRLRGVNILEFISKSIHTERKNILKKAKNKSPKILKDTNLSEVFNIEIKN